MKLRTSFFNTGVLKKDITRFLPVWLIYIFCTVIGLLTFGQELSYYEHREDLMFTLVSPMVAVNLVYAAVCAVTLFGDLYVPRMCNALHSMPIRREGWFLTHFAAGLLFSFVPNILNALIVQISYYGYEMTGFTWYLAVQLQFVLFFCTAVLCVMLAGNKLGFAAMYCIFHFGLFIAAAVIQGLYVPLLHGVVWSGDHIAEMSPLYHIWAISDAVSKGQGMAYSNFALLTGILCVILAIVLYRRRHLETAGNFFSVRFMNPVFLAVYTAAVALIITMMSALVTVEGSFSYIPVFLLGCIPGYFTGKMLLNKTSRVFHKKSWLGLILLIVILGGSMGITYLDPIGITKKIPETEDIEWASVEMDYDYNDICYSEKEELTNILKLHRFGMENPAEVNGLDSFNMRICYHLKDGKIMTRLYPVYPTGESKEILKNFYSDYRQVLGTNNVKDYESKIIRTEIRIDPRMVTKQENTDETQSVPREDEEGITGKDTGEADIWITQENAADTQTVMETVVPEKYVPQLMQAILKDCEEGTMAQNSIFHEAYKAEIIFTVGTRNDPAHEESGYVSWDSMYVYEDSAHTMKVLENMLEEMK